MVPDLREHASTATKRAGDTLAHRCREHIYDHDPPCSLGCVAFCGYAADGITFYAKPSAADCVVCEDEWRRVYGGSGT